MRKNTQADIALVEAMQQGSNAAWAECLEKHTPRLLSRIGKYPEVQRRYGHAPEDVLQTFWIRVRNRLPKYTGAAPLNYWLGLELRSVIGDYLKPRPCTVSVNSYPLDDNYEAGHQDSPEAVLVAQQRATEFIEKWQHQWENYDTMSKYQREKFNKAFKQWRLSDDGH